jgi:hypothetical protein
MVIYFKSETITIIFIMKINKKQKKRNIFVIKTVTQTLLFNIYCYCYKNCRIYIFNKTNLNCISL